jgi:hypothetical protein
MRFYMTTRVLNWTQFLGSIFPILRGNIDHVDIMIAK